MKLLSATCVLSAALLLGACDKKATTAQPTPEALLTGANAWSITSRALNGQVQSSGATVKDPLTWHFVRGGVYHETDLSDNSTVQGRWQLTNATTLHVVDHKGAPHDFTIAQLDARTLRLQWSEKAGEQHEDIYVAQ